MSLNENQIVTGVFDGAIYWAGPQAPAVTGIGQDLVTLGYSDLGYLTEDGRPELSMPGTPETQPLRMWQKAQVVRVIRTPSAEPPTFKFILAQSSVLSIALATGARVTFDESGVLHYVINGNNEPETGKLVVDVIADNSVRRYYAPNASVAEVGGLVFANDGTPLGYELTISCDYSGEIDGQIEVWELFITPELQAPPAPEFGANLVDVGPADRTDNHADQVNLQKQYPAVSGPDYGPVSPEANYVAPVLAGVTDDNEGEFDPAEAILAGSVQTYAA